MIIVLRRWRPLAAVAAAVLTFLLVPQGTRAGALPLTPLPDPGGGTIVRWSLEADGAPVASLQQCSGFGSRSPVVVSVDGATGVTTKSAGPATYPDITCTLGISTDPELYGWRANIEAGQLDRRAVVLSGLDATAVPVQEWHLLHAWPSQYIQTFDRVVVVLTSDRVTLQLP